LKQRFDDEEHAASAGPGEISAKSASLVKGLTPAGKRPVPLEYIANPPGDQIEEDPVLQEKAPPKRGWRRFLGKAFAAILSIGIAGLSICVLAHTLSSVNLDKLRHAMASTRTPQILAALGLTAVSFLALTGYDALALRQLRLRVPYSTTALASFTSYAISFTLGFALITAGTVRYWIYSKKGLSGAKVASLTIIAGVTFWLGMAVVIGFSLIFRGHAISELNHVDPQLNRVMGYGILAMLGSYLGWVSIKRRQVTMQGFKLELPGFRLTVGQTILGVIDLCAASGVLYSLLPEPRSIDFFTFAATYVFASVLGIASNAPGGIGVFEAAILQSVPATSQSALLASLLLFRILYYLLPFLLALGLLGLNVGFRRWGTVRAKPDSVNKGRALTKDR